MSFRDHFSSASSSYAAFRPRYPQALFDFLARATARRDLAWDCATGNGQAAAGIAERFARVVATDASAAQIAAAPSHPRIAYRVAAAEASGLDAGSVDLVTVAQALHWLDLPAFYREARRVLAPGGAIAVWCYSLVEIDPAIDPMVRRFHGETVGPYWPPERHLVDEGYRSVDFPFAELTTPRFAIEQAMTLDDLAGYLRTWSATKRYREEHRVDPVLAFAAALALPWGERGAIRRVRFPLHVRVGR